MGFGIASDDMDVLVVVMFQKDLIYEYRTYVNTVKHVVYARLYVMMIERKIESDW